MSDVVPVSAVPTVGEDAEGLIVSEDPARTVAATAHEASQTPRMGLSSLIGDFLGHVLAGTAGFIGLGIPAVLLSWVTHYVEGMTPIVSEYVVYVLVGVHFMLLGLDAFMFSVCMLVSVFIGARNLVRYVRAA